MVMGMLSLRSRLTSREYLTWAAGLVGGSCDGGPYVERHAPARGLAWLLQIGVECDATR